MKVRAIVNFYDLMEETMRHIGEEFEVTYERCEILSTDKNISKTPLVAVIGEKTNVRKKTATPKSKKLS